MVRGSPGSMVPSPVTRRRCCGEAAAADHDGRRAGGTWHAEQMRATRTACRPSLRRPGAWVSPVLVLAGGDVLERAHGGRGGRPPGRRSRPRGAPRRTAPGRGARDRTTAPRRGAGPRGAGSEDTRHHTTEGGPRFASISRPLGPRGAGHVGRRPAPSRPPLPSASAHGRPPCRRPRRTGLHGGASGTRARKARAGMVAVPSFWKPPWAAAPREGEPEEHRPDGPAREPPRPHQWAAAAVRRRRQGMPSGVRAPSKLPHHRGQLRGDRADGAPGQASPPATLADGGVQAAKSPSTLTARASAG